MRIEKKISPKSFELVKSGAKTYEFRLADFKINTGDTIVLKEWDKLKNSYTGRVIEKIVGYVGKADGTGIWVQEDIDKYGFQIISLK